MVDTAQAWFILGEYSSRLRKLSKAYGDANKKALLELASSLLEEIGDKLLDGWVPSSQAERLDQLIRLFRTFGLPVSLLMRAKRLIIKYVADIPEFPTGMGVEPIGLPTY